MVSTAWSFTVKGFRNASALGGFKVPRNLNAVELLEQTAPGTPSAGIVSLYVKASDHKAYIKDSTGAETDLTAGGAGASKSYVTRIAARAAFK